MRKANEIYHDINIEIAQRLYDYAEEKGLSIGQLSKQLGYSRTYLYQILKGKRNFSMKAFCELMEKTETTVSLNLKAALVVESGRVSMKNCPLCDTPPEVDDYKIVTCDNPHCDLWRIAILAEQWNHRPTEQLLIDALLAVRGIIEEGSADLEADKVIGQIDAVIQSITE